MAWLMILSVLGLWIGFAKLSVSILNWTFAQPLSKPSVLLGHIVNITAILAYPKLLSWTLGQPSLLALGRASSVEVTVFGGVLILLGVVGFLLLVWSTVEYQLAAPPRCQIACESSLLDLRQRAAAGSSWKQTLLGDGPLRRIALLPRNEQFTLHVSTKTFALPDWPAAWDGLSIVHLSDSHFRGAVARAYFETVCDHVASWQPDIVAFTGDLLDDMRHLDWLPSTFGRLTAPLGCYFVLGNHDWYQDPPAIRREFERLGWTDLAGRCVSHAPLTNQRRENVPPVPSPRPVLVDTNAGGERDRVRGSSDSAPRLILAGDETPWMGDHPSFNPDADEVRVLLSHTPDNITWARRQRVHLMLAGHTHGGQIRLPLLGPIYSPSRFGCRYSAGVFHLDPTLLVVSRGLSGREPIRYGCPPELTRLILRSA